jgi:flagellin
MTVSINTNKSALISLQNLNATNEDIVSVQNKISTGRRIENARDNASIWTIAQNQRADLGSLNAVRMGLDRATSIAEVALTAGTNISDLFNLLKEKVVAARDTTIDTTSRNLLNQDYRSLINQINRATQSAQFDGTNIFDGSLTGSLNFIADANSSLNITLTAQNLSFGGSIVTLAATDSITSASLAAVALGKVQASISNINSALGALGSQLRQIEAHNVFLSKLSDAVETGVSNLVDANLAKESARLQALNVKQELGTQALSIANRQPQQILNLFK